MSNFKSLNVAVIGGGLTGLSAALALRREGHHVSVYDKSDFVGEIGSGLGLMPNGSSLLEGKWGLDMSRAKPVTLSELVLRDYKTSNAVQRVHVGDYRGRFGYEYYGLVRVDLDQALLNAAVAENGGGPACNLFLKHRLVRLVPEEGVCEFANGVKRSPDLVIGADGDPSCRLLYVATPRLISVCRRLGCRCCRSTTS